MPQSNNNSVSLAGEFAVLSQLSLRGYDANMTLGRTKSVDILVSDPSTGRMLKLEVKTGRRAGGNSPLFGEFFSAWIMNEKHEKISDPALYYCFVNISEDAKRFRFFIMPSKIVADYVTKEHRLWLDDDEAHSRETRMRTFRIGFKGKRYRIPTPTAERYEDNWEFKAWL